MRRILLAMLVLGLTLLAAPAQAVIQIDADDVDGRLDLSLLARHFTNTPASPRMIHFRADTYDEWKLRQCARVDACSITFEANGVDAFWDVDRDRQGRFRQTCLLFKHGQQVGKGTSVKFGRSVFCSFERGIISGDPVRWRVSSLWGTTVDLAPDNGQWF